MSVHLKFETWYEIEIRTSNTLCETMTNVTNGDVRWQVCNLQTRSQFMVTLANCPKLCRNCAFPQNFHTRKLGEITVFFTVFLIVFVNQFLRITTDLFPWTNNYQIPSRILENFYWIVSVRNCRHVLFLMHAFIQAVLLM